MTRCITAQADAPRSLRPPVDMYGFDLHRWRDNAGIWADAGVYVDIAEEHDPRARHCPRCAWGVAAFRSVDPAIFGRVLMSVAATRWGRA